MAKPLSRFPGYIGAPFLWLAGVVNLLAICCREVYKYLGSGVTHDDNDTDTDNNTYVDRIESCWEDRCSEGQSNLGSLS